MNRWRYVVALLGLCATLSATSAAALEYGQFEQSRQIALLPQPLLSTGRYLLIPGQGLLWVVEDPLHSQMRIRDGVLQERHSAAGPWSKPLLGQSESSVLGRLMMALLAQDAEALAEYFTLTTLENGDGVRLVPRHPVVAERIPEIVVRGAPHPQELSWADAEGAQTHIRLTPSESSPPAPWLESLQAEPDGGAD